MKKLSERLVKARKTSGFTQKKLAEILGIAESTMNYWESGKRKVDAGSVAKIAEITKCNPTWLLTGQGDMVQTHEDQATTVEESGMDYNKIVQELVNSGDEDMLKEVDHLFAKIGRKHNSARAKLKNLPKKDAG